MHMQQTTSGAAGNGLHTTAKYIRGAAGIGLDNTIKYLRDAAGISLGTTIKHLRRKTSGAAGIGLGTMIKYLRRTTSAAAGKGLVTTIKYLVNKNASPGNNWANAHYARAGQEFLSIPLTCCGFCSKLRAPHRGTSLGSCVCWARACLLCSLNSNFSA